jgi:hypothetical protein
MTKRTICVLTITLALLCAGVMAQAAAVKATLAEVKGNVFVQPAGGAFAPAKEGMAVSEGATLKTGPDGSAILKWGDGNTMKITPLTLDKIDALKKDDKTGASQSNFLLTQGRVINRVGKIGKGSDFTVKTPAAVAGVRGTAFDMGINPETNQTTVAVAEGDVTLTAGGVDVALAAGFESSVTPGEAPVEPTVMSDEKTQELKSEVNELKTVTEETAPATSEAKPAAAEATTETTTNAVDTAVEAVQNNTVETQTIDNTINEEIINNICPGGGGCIRGTIDIANPGAD